MGMLSVVPPGVSHHDIPSDCLPSSCFALPAVTARLLRADARACGVTAAAWKVYCTMKEEHHF